MPDWSNWGCLHDLVHLGLSGTNVGDVRLIALLSFPKLETLSLRKTSITDRAIPALSRLRKIKSLNIQGTSISDEGFEHLQKSLPQAEIRFRLSGRFDGNGAWIEDN